MLSVNNGAFDVVQISEMLQSPLGKPGFLTQLADSRTIIVAKHFVAKNGISHLRI